MNKYGMRRLQLSTVIGSVLATGSVQAATITVDSPVDAPLGTYANDCTLRAAIAAANSDSSVDGCVAGTAGLDDIVFDPALAASMITVAGGEFQITSSLTITGPVEGDANGLTLSGGGFYRVIDIAGTGPGSIDVTLDSLTVTNGYLSPGYLEGGAGILSNNADLALSDVAITANYAYYGGGAINLFEGALSVDNSTISNNFDGYFGGTGSGIKARNAEVIINDSLIENNKSAYGGGGLSLDDTVAVITGASIAGNSVEYYFGGPGGGIRTTGGELTLIDSEISNNSTAFYGPGGGISSSYTELTLIGTQVSGNSIGYYQLATQAGGGLAASGGTLTLIDSAIIENTIDSYTSEGGGLSARNLTVNIERSRISSNQVFSDDGSGGGVYFDNVNGSVAYSEISANSIDALSTAYGAGITVSGGNLTLVNTTVSGNFLNTSNSYSSTGATAILAASSANLSLLHTTVADNASGNSAPTINVDSSVVLSLINSIVSGPDDAALCSIAAGTVVQSLATDVSCTGTATDPADLALGLMADNGGPTLTHAIGAGSVAVDAAGDCASDLQISLDQRGFPRDSACDIGAFELVVDGVFNDRFESVP